MGIRVQAVKNAVWMTFFCFGLAALLLIFEAKEAHAYSDPSNVSDSDFFAKINLDYPGLETVKADVQQADYATAKTHLLQYFQNRTWPVYIEYGGSDPDNPASSIVNNTFTWYGQTVNFGSDIDWSAAPWNDVQSQYVMVRFGWYGILVNEWLSNTSNTTLPDAWMRDALDFIGDQGNANTGYVTMLDIGIRAQNWTAAYAYFKNSSVIDATGNTGYLKYLWQMADYLYANIPTTGNNWLVAENSGLYAAGVYFPEFKDAVKWRYKADIGLTKYVSLTLEDDGLLNEPTDHYHAYAINSAIRIMKIASVNGYEIMSSLKDKFEDSIGYVMDFTMPNLEEPQFGDSDQRDDSWLMRKGAELFDRGDFLYVATQGAEGTVPDHTSVSYPTGIQIMRTGWGLNDKYMLINNMYSNYVASHNHPDDLSVVMYAYGDRLLVDPGRYSYDDADSIGQWLRRTTEAHNTIEVDDTAQGYVYSKLNQWISNAGYDFYDGQHNNYSGLTSRRKILFVKPGFWIVSDLVSGSGTSRKYEQLWHFKPGTVTLDSTYKFAKTGHSNAANVKVVPLDPGSVTAQLRDGYVSDEYGSYQQAKYVAYSKTVSGNVSFDTILYPEAPGENRNVRTERLTTGVATNVATAMKVYLDYGNNGNEAAYYLSHESNPTAVRSFGTYQYNGEMAYIEKTSSGALHTIAMNRGSLLADGSAHLIYASGVVANLSVRYDGSALILNSTEELSEQVKIYAPGATSVTYNGASVSFTASGNYVTVNGSNVLLFDDFEDGNANGWSNITGTWSVNTTGGNTFQQTNSATSYARSQTGSSGWDHYSVEARIKANSWGSATSGVGVLARYVDANNYYEAMFYTNNGSPVLRILKQYGGVPTTLSSKAYTWNTGTWYKLRVSVDGSTIKVFVNDVEELSVTDTSISAGSINMLAHKANAEFDNVKVTQLQDITGTTVFQADFQDANTFASAYNFAFDNGSKAGWSETGGTWSVVTQGGAKVYRQDDETASTTFALRSEQGFANSYMQSAMYTNAANGTFNGIGLIGRYQDPNNYYLFRYYTNGGSPQLRIEKVVAGTTTTLASKSYTMNNAQWYTMRVNMIGGNLTLFVNGVQELTVSDSTFMQGQDGLYAHRRDASFDDVAVSSNYAWNFENNSENGWQEETGSWNVETQGGTKVYRQPSNTQVSAKTIVAGKHDWVHYSIEADVYTNSTSGSFNGIGLLGRYKDANNYYHFRYYTNGGTPELRIERVIGGNTTVLASKSYTMNNNTWYTLKAEMSGNVLMMYVNGIKQLSVQDTSASSRLISGTAGLEAHRRDAWFDNVKVTGLGAQQWSVNDGMWQVSQGELYGDNASFNDASIVSRERWGDYTAESKVKIIQHGASPSSVALLARALGDSYAYRFNYYKNGANTYLRIEKEMYGVTEVLAEKPYTLNNNTWYTFQAAVHDHSLTFLINGVEELRVYDSSLSIGGVGLEANNVEARFDDITVKAL